MIEYVSLDFGEYSFGFAGKEYSYRQEQEDEHKGSEEYRLVYDEEFFHDSVPVGAAATVAAAAIAGLAVCAGRLCLSRAAQEKAGSPKDAAASGWTLKVRESSWRFRPLGVWKHLRPNSGRMA